MHPNQSQVLTISQQMDLIQQVHISPLYCWRTFFDLNLIILDFQPITFAISSQIQIHGSIVVKYSLPLFPLSKASLSLLISTMVVCSPLTYGFYLCALDMGSVRFLHLNFFFFVTLRKEGDQRKRGGLQTSLLLGRVQPFKLRNYSK